MKKIKPYLVNSLIVIGIFLISLYMAKIYPFGDILLGKSDSFSQYKPMLFNFIMSMKKGILTIYSFNNGLGNSFLFNYLYYLVSPINLVALPFSNSNIIFLVVICTKLLITSILVTFYAKKKNSSNFVSLIATISYAFCGWFIAYYYNIMWLDLFMVFPLFQYGLEKLIEDKRCLIFIFSLAYIYATNFLIAFSVLVYMIIYFIIRNFFYSKENIKEKIKRLGLFLISFITSMLLIAFYIYALFIVKKQMGLGFSNVEDAGYTLNTMGFFQSLLYGNYNATIKFDGATFPNLGMNTIILLSFLYFVFNNKISLKNKIFFLIGLNFVLWALFVKNFDYVINMFHNVVGLTYRYSFIFNFLAIMLFIHNANNIDIKKNKLIYLPIIIALIIVIACKNVVNKEILIMNVVYILSYLVIIIFYNETWCYKLLILFLVSSQAIYVLYYALPFNNTIAKTEKIDNKFYTEPIKYRVNTIGENDFLNKNLYTNENATYLFTSMTYNPVLTMLRNIGCATGGNVIICNDKNLLFNVLFNVKNDYYLEKIYSVNKETYNVILDQYNTKNSFSYLIDGMTGIKDIYEKKTISPVKEKDKYMYYVDADSYLIDNIYDDGETINTFQTYKEFYYENGRNEPVDIYILKNDKLEDIYNYLKEKQIEYTYYSDNKIEGKINVGENQMIFTSIPYDESWIIKIDGKEVKPVKLLDSLMGIECSSGEHSISLEYKVNFTIPIIISLSNLSILVIRGIYNIKFKKNIKKHQF